MTCPDSLEVICPRCNNEPHINGGVCVICTEEIEWREGRLYETPKDLYERARTEGATLGISIEEVMAWKRGEEEARAVMEHQKIHEKFMAEMEKGVRFTFPGWVLEPPKRKWDASGHYIYTLLIGTCLEDSRFITFFRTGESQTIESLTTEHGIIATGRMRIWEDKIEWRGSEITLIHER